MNILLLILLNMTFPPPANVPAGSYLTWYWLTSTFLSRHGTRPHVKVMPVWEVEETWRSVGGEEGAACMIRNRNTMNDIINHMNRD